MTNKTGPYPYIIQGKNITVVIGDKVHTFASTHMFYDRVKEAIKRNDWDTVDELIDPKATIISYGAGNLEIQGETVQWRGKPLATSLTMRIIQMYQEGFSLEPFVRFMDKLDQNPSKRAVTELYGFLEKGELPLHPDGDFLAYKKVRGDYLDIHSGTMDNSVGKIVEMPRNEVDDDKDRTCSTGLHFCSKAYLPHFGRNSGDRVMILKINPRDVVSIPADYNDAKGRACRYEVIGEIDKDKADEALGKSSVQAAAAPETAAEAHFFYDGAWIPQEYDANGNPYSMTRDAIRKRRARASGASW